MPFVGTWVQVEIIILSEICQKEILYITYMWNLNTTQMNLYLKPKQTQRLLVAKEGHKWGRDGLGVWN